MSCLIMGIVQCISVVLAFFIKNTIFRNLRRKSTFFDQFLKFKLQNVEDKCLYKMQTVLYQYLNRKHDIYWTLNYLLFKTRQQNAYEWPFWEHITDHISKTGNVSSLKSISSRKRNLTLALMGLKF